jgi:thiamine biosynthesis lipoprotein
MDYYHFEFKAMGTPCDIQLFAQNETQAKRASDLAIADVRRLEQRYSRYRADSFLSAINRVAAVGGKITVDAETSGLLNYAETCHLQSDGLFDITSGLLRQAWRFDGDCLPDSSQIHALLAKVGWHKLRWQAPTLHFPVPGLEIDFGGIVKEYAVDRAAVLCQSAGIRHGVINLGGDIKIIGPRADDSPWLVGIRHPRNVADVLTTLPLHSGALASSGDYERCIIVDGIRYGHVLNPKTGWPVRQMAAVSVVADFCVVAGSAATIAMLKENAGARWLDGLGLPHCWVTVLGETGGDLLPMPLR